MEGDPRSKDSLSEDSMIEPPESPKIGIPIKPGVSPWWRVLAVLAIVGLVVFWLSSVIVFSGAPTTRTQVEWSSYAVSGGPGDTNNETTIPGEHFCAPAYADTVGIFSMVWMTSTGKAVHQFRIWTIIPPNMTITPLYVASNYSSGGISFLSTYPTPCSLAWVLDVESTEAVVVYAIATLTFNYTSATSTTFGP
jgi:hypothetical protein